MPVAAKKSLSVLILPAPEKMGSAQVEIIKTAIVKTQNALT